MPVSQHPDPTPGDADADVDAERRERRAGERAIERADQALDVDDAGTARREYLAAAGPFRRAADQARTSGDQGARRADEDAALQALRAAQPITPGAPAVSSGQSTRDSNGGPPVRSSPA